MTFAEGPSIDGGALALILGILLITGIAWLAAAILGFRWAVAFARGSDRAAVLWGIAALILLFPGVLGRMFFPVGVVVVAAQAVAYVSTRRRG